ncbi:MAG: histidine phosphatase family protein [Parachlamydiaceae bacterium]|nr:histidine phosphatase family protein [Parachlamydiaceae bacterium]
MGHKYTQFLMAGFFLCCSMSAFSSSAIGTQSDLTLVSKVDSLREWEHLPITDDFSDRMYLVRHGESTANVYFEVDGKKVRYVSGQSLGIPLTELGKKQILRLAQKLVDRFPKEARLVITSSPALRTQQTAKILFKELSKTHANVSLAEEVYPGLNERSLGQWEGQLKDENYAKAETPWKALSAVDKLYSPEVVGGESYVEVAHRAVSAIAEIHDRYSESTVIAVTSFNTINTVAIQINHLEAFLSTVPGTSLPKLDLGNGDLVLLENPKGLSEQVQAKSHIKNE